ncbi:hypothetical protein PLICRDRAFT_410009 [Plicaturopsis crispa FD-325 SS-3]|nr:hypothetical protein PLICRDRAFT_410009 [Plicaturopsis crispa FD-325 SS-3]
MNSVRTQPTFSSGPSSGMSLCSLLLQRREALMQKAIAEGKDPYYVEVKSPPPTPGVWKAPYPTHLVFWNGQFHFIPQPSRPAPPPPPGAREARARRLASARLSAPKRAHSRDEDSLSHTLLGGDEPRSAPSPTSEASEYNDPKAS